MTQVFLGWWNQRFVRNCSKWVSQRNVHRLLRVVLAEPLVYVVDHIFYLLLLEGHIGQIKGLLLVQKEQLDTLVLLSFLVNVFFIDGVVSYLRDRIQKLEVMCTLGIQVTFITTRSKDWFLPIWDLFLPGVSLTHEWSISARAHSRSM